MARRHVFQLIAAFAATSVCALGCLPVDSRLPPAEVHFVAAPGDDPAGVTTSDGWTISVERLLVGIGDASLGDPCERYSESRYFRLLDGTRPGDQKIGTVYGLGRCDFSFRVAWPDDTTLLGEGVTEDDLVRMSTTQPFPGNVAKGGIGVELTATATKNSTTKHVAWSFGQATTYDPCGNEGPTNPLPREFQSHESVVMRVFLSGSAIFGADKGETPPLAFDPIAAADDAFGNQDGEVTLEEINKVSLSEARRYGPYGVSASNDVSTLRGYVFLQTLGNVARIRDGIDCIPRLGIRETR